MRAVLDSSAALASIQAEPGAEKVTAVIEDSQISTVNLAEVATVLSRTTDEEDVRTILQELPIQMIAPDAETAIDAGLLRSLTDSAGLSLGDRFCLALARRLSLPVMTADRAWLRIAETVEAEVQLIR